MPDPPAAAEATSPRVLEISGFKPKNYIPPCIPHPAPCIQMGGSTNGGTPKILGLWKILLNMDDDWGSPMDWKPPKISIV